jgi:7-cyano-7-deazaguanine synthase
MRATRPHSFGQNLDLKAHSLSTEFIMPRAVVLLSGGLDSSTLVFHMRSEGYDVTALSIDYGQRHVRELEAARLIAQAAGVAHLSVNLGPALRPVFALSKSSQVGLSPSDVPHGHYADENMRTTIIPNRNMMLLSIAGALAESLRGVPRSKENPEQIKIAYAAHAGDHAVYPDCRPEFFVSCAETLWKATDGGCEMYAPFIKITKTDIAKRAASLGVPIALTYSCLASGTLVRALRGDVPIESLAIGTWVWGWLDDVWAPALVQNVFDQGEKETFTIVLNDKVGRLTEVVATADHRFMTRLGAYVRLDQLKPGDSLMPCSMSTVRPGELKVPYHTIRPHADWTEPNVYVHRYVAEWFGIEGEVIHHSPDEDTFNNDPENLVGMTRGDHTRHHMTDYVRSSEANEAAAAKQRKLWAGMSQEQYDFRCQQIREGRQQQPGTAPENHVVVSVTPAGVRHTWDIQTSTQNFGLTAGVFVHNCYEGRAEHCSKCGTCVERIESLRDAGIVDPTSYEQTV